MNIDNQQKDINIFFKYNNYYDYQKLKDSSMKYKIEYMNNRIQDELNTLLAERHISTILSNGDIIKEIDKAIGTMIQKELKGLK